MTRQLRKFVIGLVGLALAGIIASAGCSPLPGRTLDPVYLKLGTERGGEAAQTTSSPAQASTQAQVSPSPQPSSQGRPMPTGESVWVGRYRDSRGEGDITFSLVRGETTVSGTWKLRTGGDGPIVMTLEGGTQRFQLRMENIAPKCPARLEGSAEFRGTSLVGTYQGRDCEGPVSAGSFELHVK